MGIELIHSVNGSVLFRKRLSATEKPCVIAAEPHRDFIVPAESGEKKMVKLYAKQTGFRSTKVSRHNTKYLAITATAVGHHVLRHFIAYRDGDTCCQKGWPCLRKLKRVPEVAGNTSEILVLSSSTVSARYGHLRNYQ